MKLNYRPDIDGLRAVAVLAVVLNHAGFKAFGGGFVGVDVFFVISGYLITTIISNEINEGKFSVLKFYERRIRRIFPALFATLLFTLLVSAILYDAKSFVNIGKSITATTLFYSNFLFWSETGYFEAPSQLKPLLHTWSLAVEEQYYIVFPLMLWGLFQVFKNKISYVLVFIAILSFAWSVYGASNNSSDAFYLPHMRAWELLIGSILALGLAPEVKSSHVGNLLSALGLAAITLPFLYSADTLFPGWTALAPTLGTALIIYSGSKNIPFVNKLLGLRPFVFIGLISYSLYLWHWPILVFAKYYAIKQLTLWEICILILIILVVSIFSWRFIEKPFRSKIVGLEGKKLFSYATMIMIAFISSGFFINLNEGFPRENASLIPKKNPNTWQGWGGCEKRDTKYSIKICNFGNQHGNPRFLLVGDSFAPAVGYGIHRSAKKLGVAGQIIYNFRCPPLLGMQRIDVPDCFTDNKNTMRYLEDHPEISTVILIGRWARYAEGSGYNPGAFSEGDLTDEEGESIVLSDGWSENADISNKVELFALGLNRTVEKLLQLNKKVVIISQIPEIGYDVPSAYSIASRTGRDINQIIAPSLEQYLFRSGSARDVIEKIAQTYNLIVIDPSTILCDDTICYVERDGFPLYADATHLSIYESENLAFLYDPIFKELSKSK